MDVGQEVQDAPRVTVLMTSHNRYELTRRCLASVFSQCDVRAHVILNDDGSTDATKDLASEYPTIKITRGSGNDYWAGGMRRAWRAMDLQETDYVVLVNDDVELDEDALAGLVQVAQEHRPCLVGGSVRDEKTGEVTYGGNRSSRRCRRLKMTRVFPSDAAQPVDALNGNVLLMSAAVAAQLGGLNARFTHGMADYELSWRASRMGIPSILAPGFVGNCSANTTANTWRDTRLPRRTRLRKLQEPKGLPAGQWLFICWRHGGAFGLFDFVAPYLRVLLGR